MIYTTHGKEVLEDGRHFADCRDEEAARLAALALHQMAVAIEHNSLNIPAQMVDFDAAAQMAAKDPPAALQMAALHTLQQLDAGPMRHTPPPSPGGQIEPDGVWKRFAEWGSARFRGESAQSETVSRDAAEK